MGMNKLIPLALSSILLATSAHALDSEDHVGEYVGEYKRGWGWRSKGRFLLSLDKNGIMWIKHPKIGECSADGRERYNYPEERRGSAPTSAYHYRARETSDPLVLAPDNRAMRLSERYDSVFQIHSVSVFCKSGEWFTVLLETPVEKTDEQGGIAGISIRNSSLRVVFEKKVLLKRQI